jgi:hypothetical protein
MQLVRILKQVLELVQYAGLIGNNAILHINEAGGRKAGGCLSNEARLTAGNFKMLANNLLCDRTAVWCQLGGIQVPGIILAVQNL